MRRRLARVQKGEKRGESEHMSKRKLAAVFMLAILAIGVAIAFGTILYTLTIPGTWNVMTAYGLTLENATTYAPITSISFSCPARARQNTHLSQRQARAAH
jgi:hypothetical protein